MTKEEILEMGAGTKLDSLVHESVMGLCHHEWHRHSKAGETVGVICAKCGKQELFIEDRVPLYSTDISAAWPVLEEIFARGYHWVIMTVYLHSQKPKYKVLAQQIVRIGKPKDYEVEAAHVEEAICKAALLAKLRPD